MGLWSRNRFASDGLVSSKKVRIKLRFSYFFTKSEYFVRYIEGKVIVKHLLILYYRDSVD